MIVKMAKCKIVKFSKPSETYRNLMRIVRACSGAVGADVADPNYRINYRTCLCMLSILIYFIFTGMTVYKLFRDDWKVLLEASCMAGSVIQGLTKLIVAIIKTKEVCDTDILLTHIYEKYEQLDERYVRLLNGNVRRQRRIIIATGLGYLLTVIVMVLLPFVLMAWNGSRILIMHFQLPGIDIGTNFGYFATNLAHMFCIFFGAFGLFSGDSFTITYMMQCFMFDDIFKLKVAYLNEQVADGVNWRNERKVNQLLTDIVQWHQLYTQYMAKCNSMFYIIITVQVVASAMAIVLTIFIMLTSSWPPAYAYLLLTIYNLYVFCVLGTMIESTNDNFTYEIYNMAWYNMRVSQQKTVRLMLMKSQSPALIQVAGILPLSVSTAMKVTKTIYTITMLIIQFFVD